VVGREPRVEHLGDIDAPVAKNQRAWRLLAAVTRVALDTNRDHCHIPRLAARGRATVLL
jgi:hypothetical protein